MRFDVDLSELMMLRDYWNESLEGIGKGVVESQDNES